MSQHKILTPSGAFEYQLNRSLKRRRTMEIHIRHEGVVQVHAPSSFSMTTIEGFLRRKAKWITQKLAMFRDRQAFMLQRDSGAVPECFYLGRSYPVALGIQSARWGQILFGEGGWTVEIPERIHEDGRRHYAREFLEKWFKSRALVVLQERVVHYGGLMEDRPEAVRIRSPKSLWGSCHPAKRVLHFNWRIIMAPIQVVDYLVVHELSHLRIANHSQRFWSRVMKFCPEYKSSQIWLKQNGYQLRLPFGH
jgi:predicted metal-dependent hydrolase